MKPYEVLFSWYSLDISAEVEDVLIVYGVDEQDAEKEFMRQVGSRYNGLLIEEINLNYNF